MYKIEVIDESERCTVPMNELPTGALAIVCYPGSAFHGHYVLSEGSHICDLTDPKGGGWSSQPSTPCRILSPGSTITLRVK